MATCNTYSAAIGLTGKIARKPYKVGNGLTALHLIKHGALNISRDLDKLSIWRHRDQVSVTQGYVPAAVAVENIIVYIDIREELAAAVYLDTAERTQIAHAAGHMQRMEERSERRKGVCT